MIGFKYIPENQRAGADDVGLAKSLWFDLSMQHNPTVSPTVSSFEIYQEIASVTL